VDQLTIFVDGDQKGSSSDGAVLQRMEAMERYVKKYADPGAVISLVNIIRVFWETNHYGDPKWGFVPDSAAAVSRVIFQLMQSSTPGALRPFLTDEQEDANITFFFGDHRGDTIRKAVHYAEEFIVANPMGRLSVRLYEPESGLKDALYYIFGPMLPPRDKRMTVHKAILDEEQETRGYEKLEPRPVGEWRRDPLERDAVETNVMDTVAALGSRKRADVTLSSDLRDDLKLRKEQLSKIALKLSSDFDYRIETARRDAPTAMAGFRTVNDIVEHVLSRAEYFVDEEWSDPELAITAQNLRFCRHYCEPELWVKNAKFKDSSWNPQPTGSWTRGAEFVMAGGIMGILAAVNEEVERGNVANILLIFVTQYVLVAITYRSNATGVIIMISIAIPTVISLYYMAVLGTGLNVNTLPVQSVGVGVGGDYALYLTDRIRQETSWCGDLNEGIRRAIVTTGMATTFTASTLTASIVAWAFSGLRYQAEMAQLLSIILVANWVSAIMLMPSLYSIWKPKILSESLAAEIARSATERAEGGSAAAGG
jgi:hypothetical protein